MSDNEPVMPKTFSWPLSVYYEDTDAGGVVYYANYLKFMERARTEWLRAAGFGLGEMADKDRVLFVIARADIEYRSAARLDDRLVVESTLDDVRGARVVFRQRVLKTDGELVCSGTITAATVHAETLAPRRLPAGLEERMNNAC